MHFEGSILRWLTSSAGCCWGASALCHVGCLCVLTTLCWLLPPEQVTQENKAETAALFTASLRSGVPSLLRCPISKHTEPYSVKESKDMNTSGKDIRGPSWSLPTQAANAMCCHCPFCWPPTLFHCLFVKRQEGPLSWIQGINKSWHTHPSLLVCPY